MAEETFLTDDFLRQLTAAGEADILVAVPTLNNAKTIEHVLSAMQVGLVKYFPRARAALISLDSGSKDGTPELVQNLSIRDFRSMLAAPPLRTMHTLTASYRAVQGAGGALRTVLAAADLLRAKACALVSPDLESITPEWVDRLVRPIYREQFDFVAPVYQRHKFDGLLLKQILTPLIAAAYGYEIEEPMAAEYAFSGRLAGHYLDLDVWQQDFMRYGAEMGMVTTALAGGFRVCQSFLGPKIHFSKSPAPDLAAAIQEVLGTLFNCLEMHESFWKSRTAVETPPTFGFEYDLDLHPVRVDRKRMFRMFQSGVEQLASVLELIMSPETLRRIRASAQASDGNAGLEDDLWARTVYEFAASFHHSVISRDHILQALTPLYRGRVSSFLGRNRDTDLPQVKEELRALRVQYQELKPYFLERWSASA